MGRLERALRSATGSMPPQAAREYKIFLDIPPRVFLAVEYSLYKRGAWVSQTSELSNGHTFLACFPKAFNFDIFIFIYTEPDNNLKENYESFSISHTILLNKT